MRAFLQKYRIEVLIFAVALLARLALFFVNFSGNDHELIPTIKGDDGYYELSQNLLYGNGFSFDTEPPFNPNPLRPPLWPFLIALFAKIGGYWAVLAFEMLLGSMIPVLGLLVARFLVPEKYARVIGWLLVFEPYSVLLSFILYTETSFIFFFLIFVLFFFKYLKQPDMRGAVWSGVFLGLSALIKPTVQFLPVLLPIFIFLVFRKKLSAKVFWQMLVFVAVFSAVMSPWFFRNYHEFGKWGISAQPAFNLYVYLAPSVMAIDNGTGFAEELKNFVYRDGFDVNSINLGNSDYFKDKAMGVILERKTALAKSVLMTLATFFTHDGMLTVLQYSGVVLENTAGQPFLSMLFKPGELLRVVSDYAGSPALVIILGRLAWIFIFFMFVAGIFAMRGKLKSSPQAVLALLFVFYFALTTAINGFGVNARFRAPVLVFVFAFAVAGFIFVAGRVRFYLRAIRR